MKVTQKTYDVIKDLCKKMDNILTHYPKYLILKINYNKKENVFKIRITNDDGITVESSNYKDDDMKKIYSSMFSKVVASDIITLMKKCIVVYLTPLLNDEEIQLIGLILKVYPVLELSEIVVSKNENLENKLYLKIVKRNSWYKHTNVIFIKKDSFVNLKLNKEYTLKELKLL